MKFRHSIQFNSIQYNSIQHSQSVSQSPGTVTVTGNQTGKGRDETTGQDDTLPPPYPSLTPSRSLLLVSGSFKPFTAGARAQRRRKKTTNNERQQQGGSKRTLAKQNQKSEKKQIQIAAFAKMRKRRKKLHVFFNCIGIGLN
jgi:hypothetical protein